MFYSGVAVNRLICPRLVHDDVHGGVTRTVSQVIEKTIQQVSAPQSAAVGTVTLSVDDQLANAVASVSPGVVKIEDMRSNAVVGLGLIISKDGIIITDKSIITPASSYEALFSDGTSVCNSPSICCCWVDHLVWSVGNLASYFANAASAFGICWSRRAGMFALSVS